MPQHVTVTNDTAAPMRYTYTIMAGNVDCTNNNVYIKTVTCGASETKTIEIPEANIKSVSSTSAKE
jgi:hypothetical protein